MELNELMSQTDEQTLWIADLSSDTPTVMSAVVRRQGANYQALSEQGHWRKLYEWPSCSYFATREAAVNWVKEKLSAEVTILSRRLSEVWARRSAFEQTLSAAD